MSSFFQKRWVQDTLVYGAIGIIILLIIFGIVRSFQNVSNPVTGTEVHWHAPISYEACGETLTLTDSGNHSIIHGHDDDQVHVEGLVLSEEDITLAQFFKNAGLNITNANLEEYKNGDICENTGVPGQVNFEVDGQSYTDPSQIIIQDKQNILVKFE